MSNDGIFQNRVTTEAQHSYTITQHAKPVGYWVMYPQATPYMSFAMYHKPTDEQIKNTEQLLGWGWKDA